MPASEKINEQNRQRFILVGLNIAYYRKLRGMTQLDLAERANISRTYISKLEAPNMSVAISLAKLFDLADVLEVEPHKLLEFR